MSQEMRDFGKPDFFEPDAQGQPGNRRFRIIAQQGVRTASLWLEREQLQDLVASIQRLLAQLTGSDILRSETETPEPLEPRATFTSYPDVEFQVGPMALGYDEDSQRILFLVSPIETVEREGEAVINTEAEPQFRALLATSDLERFVQLAEGLFAAGRPRCPLCGQALTYVDEPHGCIKQNGHRHIEVD